MKIISSTKKNTKDLDILIQTPQKLNDNSYYSNLYLDKEDFFLIQTPEVFTNGIVDTEKKEYIDLHLTDKEFISWIQSLETKFKDIIYQNINDWFNEVLTKDDIETFFQSILREKNNEFILRCYTNCNDVNKMKHNNINTVSSLKIFNHSLKEQKEKKDIINKNIISILHFKGIHFTNICFYLDIEIKQIMILERKKEDIFETCLIHRDTDDEISVNSDNSNTSNEIQHCKNDKISNKMNDKICMDENENENENSCIPEDISVNNTEKENIYLGNNKHYNDDKNNKDIIETQISNTKDNNKDCLQEITLESLDNINQENTVKLKNPNQVYQDIYKEARRKAKQAKKDAIVAYLELKHIKNTYMIYDSDDSSIDDYLDNSDNISILSYEEIK